MAAECKDEVDDASPIQTEHDVFCVCVTHMYKMVHKNTSCADCFASLEIFKAGLSARLQELCPSTWFGWVKVTISLSTSLLN